MVNYQARFLSTLILDVFALALWQTNRVHPSFAKMISSVSRKAHVGYKRAFRLALQIYAHRDAPNQHFD